MNRAAVVSRCSCISRRLHAYGYGTRCVVRLARCLHDTAGCETSVGLAVVWWRGAPGTCGSVWFVLVCGVPVHAVLGCVSVLRVFRSAAHAVGPEELPFDLFVLDSKSDCHRALSRRSTPSQLYGLQRLDLLGGWRVGCRLPCVQRATRSKPTALLL